MSSVTIKKVSSKKDLERFVDFHYDLYEGCEQDVPNLFSDEMNTLDKTKNAAFEFSEAEYFMAFYEDGRMAGRVAAIINHRANKRWGRKCVRFGWIDFVDDIEVSRALFNAVEDYGKSKGMDEMRRRHRGVARFVQCRRGLRQVEGNGRDDRAARIHRPRP